MKTSHGVWIWFSERRSMDHRHSPLIAFRLESKLLLSARASIQCILFCRFFATVPWSCRTIYISQSKLWYNKISRRLVGLALVLSKWARCRLRLGLTPCPCPAPEWASRAQTGTWPNPSQAPGWPEYFGHRFFILKIEKN